METGQKGGFGLPCVLIFLKFFYFFHEISAYPFGLITYRSEGAVYFVTDTLIALQTGDTKTFYTIRHEEPRFIDIRNGHTYRCKGIRFPNIDS